MRQRHAREFMKVQRCSIQARWPITTAALTPVAILLALRDRRWSIAAALLVHQTEEWAWPGHFQRRMNREMLGSDRDDFPLTDAIGFRVNVLLGWSAVSLATLGGARAAPVRAAVCANHLGNAALHTVWAVRRRGYNPGLVTAFVALLPVAVAGLWPLRRQGHTKDRVAAAAGLAAAAVVVPALRGSWTRVTWAGWATSGRSAAADDVRRRRARALSSISPRAGTATAPTRRRLGTGWSWADGRGSDATSMRLP